MGMKCDCRADISSKVGVKWREGRGWSVRGRRFREERVGGFGCGKGSRVEGVRGEREEEWVEGIFGEVFEGDFEGDFERDFERDFESVSRVVS